MSIVVFILFCICLFGALYLFEGMFFRGGMRAVYMASTLREQSTILNEIIRTYTDDTSGVSFVEPGAGLGMVTRFFAQKYSWKRVTAIELRPTVFWTGKLLAQIQGVPVHYLRQDLFNYSYQPGSFIYCYLTTPIITRLYQEGAFTGSVVVCLTFAITGAVPAKSYQLKGWQQILRVYDFR